MTWLPLKLKTYQLKTVYSLLNRYSTAAKAVTTVNVNGKAFEADDYTNITPKIASYLNSNLHLKKNHPLSLVRQRIVNYFYTFRYAGNPEFSVYDNLNPVVSTKQNFDDLLIPLDHVSRAKSDCYYINRGMLLRAHMTAHQSELLRSGLNNFLMIGDVYRRDEIDSTHFPVFHQVDAVRSLHKERLFPKQPDLEIFEPQYDTKNPFTFKNTISDPMKQSCHTLEATKVMETQLKNHLIGMVKTLFGKDIKHRWVDAYFPFTHPSWELEIFYENKWMEVLGCGIVRNEILVNAGPSNTIAYAFGLGLERLAMALYKIPDIRLMWSNDSGFLTQFENKDLDAKITYKPVSSYPQCTNDLSFWLPENLSIDTFMNNDFYELVRGIGGDIVEQVKLKDKFVHPKTKKHSLCYSIVYRHLERTLTQEEVNKVHKDIEVAVATAFNVVIR
ncbi:probable phenylalanine--tRNA ligase, mitochondrial [Plutella xylostella]|uniref:probable phenylalanine--tRNA ligase, mitochondrial n=1 Tax=Plutella xylostella TaxID=51655 RepID=UPI0020329B88|nr:probable phenylalanine--tRNA ligase, mitochondrial [Plutella xylostella]XP_011554747.3 probable phenylalanine--tRNA ligase, mitochondrial [Plutella xylostella]XP_037965446.2 probable phenylalanine--tRNA ligase, mitochondrial [Plutella xylostella]